MRKDKRDSPLLASSTHCRGLLGLYLGTQTLRDYRVVTEISNNYRFLRYCINAGTERSASSLISYACLDSHVAVVTARCCFIVKPAGCEKPQ